MLDVNFTTSYAREFEVQEQVTFQAEKQIWLARYNEAVLYRSMCGWNTRAYEGWKIRTNNLPTQSMQAAPNWRGTYVKDNWVWKGIKWLTSIMIGADIGIDLKTMDGLQDPKLDLLQIETTFLKNLTRAQDVDKEVLLDKYYTGFGVCRSNWNTAAKKALFPTGTPRFEQVDSRKFFFDPGAQLADNSDARWIFHVEYYPIERIKKLFPQHANLIMEQLRISNSMDKGKAELVTLQYKQTLTIPKVIITDRQSGTAETFTTMEFKNILQAEYNNPEAQSEYNRMVQEAQETRPYDQWLLTDWIFPEDVEVSNSMDFEEEACYQAILLPGLSVILDPPKYIGEDYTYHWMCAFKADNSPYPLALAHYLKDTLHASVVLMTVLLIQAVKFMRSKEMIVEGSLVNEQTYIESGWQVGVSPIVKNDFAKNSDQKAVQTIEPPRFPSELLTLQEMLKDSSQTATGAIDAAIGTMQGGADSGYKVAQLQAASRIYLKEDVDDYRIYLTRKYTWLSRSIALYRTYPHTVMGADENDKPAIMEVNTAGYNRLSAENCYCEVSITENHEIAQQIAMEVGSNLLDRKLMSGLDYLRLQPGSIIPDPQKTYDHALQERNLLFIEEANEKIPGLMDMIVQFVQQYANPAQPGQPGQPGGGQPGEPTPPNPGAKAPYDVPNP